jgi:hypothetical protein
MSSLLSHHDLSRNSLANYLRGYKHDLPISPADWASAESMGLEEGAIIVLLEPVVPVSASAERAAAADTFRVTELAIAIGKDNERPIVIRVTSETFELIFLEKLMQSKAQDAKLLDRDFSYAIVEPAYYLTEEQVKTIQQLGYSFARGGSRREKNPDGTGLMDPSIALLTALGLKLDQPGRKQLLDLGLFCQLVFEPVEPPAESAMHDVKSSFKPVPLASIAPTPAQVQTESAGTAANKQAAEPAAAAHQFIDDIPNDEFLPEPSAPASQTEPPKSEPKEPTVTTRNTGESKAEPAPPAAPPSSFKGLGSLVPGANGEAQRSRRERLKDDLQTLLGVGGIFAEKQEDKSQAAPDGAQAKAPEPPAPANPWDAEPTEPASPKDSAPATSAKPANPWDPEPEPAEPADLKTSAPTASAQPANPWDPDPVQPAEPATAWAPPPPLPTKKKTLSEPTPFVPRDAEKAVMDQLAAAIEEAAAPAPAAPDEKKPSLDRPDDTKASSQPGKTDKSAPPSPWERMLDSKAPASSTPVSAKLTEEDEEEEDEDDGDEEEQDTTAKRQQTASSIKPPTAASSLPRALESDKRTGKGSGASGAGMEMLVSRIEQQVSKAANLLISQVGQIHSGLESEIKKLTERVTRAEEQNETSMRTLLQSINRQLDDLMEDSRLRVSDASANGRYAIKQLLEQGQKELDDTQKESLDLLQTAVKEFRQASDKLADGIRQNLDDTIKSKTGELNGLIDSICLELNSTNEEYGERLKARFDRLRDRLAYEGESTSGTLARHVNSLREDLEGLCERAVEKIKSNKNEHEIGLRQLVTMYELNLSQTANKLASELLVPKLREYRESLRNERFDLEKQLADESTAQSAAHLSALEENMGGIKQNLQQLLSESLARIETTGVEHKESLGKLFKDAADYIESGVARAQVLFQEAEAEIAENDTASRKLVEISGAGTDPIIISDKEAAVKTAQQLKENALLELQGQFDKQCEKLEQKGQAALTKLTKGREKHTRAVTEAADDAIALIRKAIQDASQAIRSTQEKYME